MGLTQKSTSHMCYVSSITPRVARLPLCLQGLQGLQGLQDYPSAGNISPQVARVTQRFSKGLLKARTQFNSQSTHSHINGSTFKFVHVRKYFLLTPIHL